MMKIKLNQKFIKKIADKSNLDISKYDMKQLVMGYKVELEHDKGKTDVVTNVVAPLKIAMAHLDELPDYYDRLKKIENESSLKEIIRKEVRKILREVTQSQSGVLSDGGPIPRYRAYHNSQDLDVWEKRARQRYDKEWGTSGDDRLLPDDKPIKTKVV